MVIDVHTHIGKHDNKDWTPEQLISSMDKAGIHYSLVIADEQSTEKTIELCEKHDRLEVIGGVDYSALSDRYVETLIGYLESKKVCALKLYPGYQNYFPQDTKLYPLYKHCQEHNRPIVIHTGVLEAGYPGLLKQVHPLNVDDVANKFPRLTIVMAHFGNPWIMDAAAVVAKNTNVYVDLSGYFLEYEPITQNQVGYFVKDLAEFKFFVGGYSKCLFGTDWPLYDQKEYVDAVKKLSMTDEEKDLVFWKNAKKVFNVNAP